jgi:hypothetical protein
MPKRFYLSTRKDRSAQADALVGVLRSEGWERTFDWTGRSNVGPDEFTDTRPGRDRGRGRGRRTHSATARRLWNTRRDRCCPGVRETSDSPCSGSGDPGYALPMHFSLPPPSYVVTPGGSRCRSGNCQPGVDLRRCRLTDVPVSINPPEEHRSLKCVRSVRPGQLHRPRCDTP